MNNDIHSNPIETIIDFAWAAGANRFWVNNAKDELKKIREKIKEYENESNRLCESMVKKTDTVRS